RSSDVSLALLADDVPRGVEEDERSREQFIATYTQCMDLLGLKLESDGNQTTQTNRAKVRDTLLLESVIKSVSTARGELLPAAGPCKVSVAGDETEGLDDLARFLEQDMNW